MAEQKLSPLGVFDARIVQTPLQGLLRNMDSELARLLKQAMTSRNSEAERNKVKCLSIPSRLRRNFLLVKLSRRSELRSGWSGFCQSRSGLLWRQFQ